MDFIGRNIKCLREANGFTQQNIADYLEIKRSAYSNYETDAREIPFKYLEKLATLFGCDLDVLLSENEEDLKGMLICAFRADTLDNKDLKAIAEFKDFVLNYLKISKLIKQ
jgi:transcriptional regulator with XRE-family HTH domain